MGILNNKIDFAVLVTVEKANPNGDPLNGNRPREDYDGFGEISDVCIKRKIRNRFQDMGESIFVQSQERADDGFASLSERAKNTVEMKEASKLKDKDVYANVACKKWIDVRTFGQVFAFKSGDKEIPGVSVGVRGPVSIHPAVSQSTVDITSMQITKSVNSEPGEGKSSDTMGMKHRVEFGLYLVKGSINCQLAQKTGFSDDDAEKLKRALLTLFDNDCSSARPDGSMQVKRLYWWKHNCPSGQYSSGKVHNSLHITEDQGHLNTFSKKFVTSFEDYKIELSPLEGLNIEVYEGI